jgi:type VI secretion system secreted protein Hcp
VAVVLKLVDARGTPIKGESKVAGHVDEIDVLAWSWGVTAPAGAKFDILDMSIRKSFDLASPKILVVTAAHEILQSGVLTVIDQQGMDQLVVTLKKIQVESVSIAEEPKEYSVAENVALRFDEIEFSYRGEKVVVKRGGPGGGPVIARRKR